METFATFFSSEVRIRIQVRVRTWVNWIYTYIYINLPQRSHKNSSHEDSRYAGVPAESIHDEVGQYLRERGH